MDIALTETPLPTLPTWHVPPRLHGEDGAPRRVGVEIELGGLDIPSLTAVVHRFFGGHAVTESSVSADVRDTLFGDFRVELDSLVLKKQRHAELLAKVGIGDDTRHRLEELMEKLASTWIPHEIVTPPLLVTDLPRLDALQRELHRMGAKGTRASVVNMFGFQLNPQVPSSDAPTIVAHIRAFLALYDWLAIGIDVDLARRIVSFTDPFPESYRRKVLAPDYAPDFATLLSDYLDENPTRNRALDMLPFFSFVDRATVMARCKEPDQVKPRPTFHYRLPNCCIDDPAWSFALEWNRWVEVERLAADPRRLARVSAEAVASMDEHWSSDDVIRASAGWGLST